MRRLTALTAAAVSLPVLAGVSADEAAKLGNELTPIGAISAGNEAGTIPAWIGQELFSQEVQDLSRDELEQWRKKDPKKIEDLVFDEIERNADKFDKNPLESTLTITKANYKQHASKLTVGHQKMFELYDDYKMIVYPTVRTAFFPEEIFFYFQLEQV